MKNLKTYLSRRKKGSTIIESGMTFLLACIFIVVLISSMKPLSDLIKVRTVARQYMLKAESVGYLTAANQTALKAALQAKGIPSASVDLTGTTSTPASPGADVNLVIKYTTTVKAFNAATLTFSNSSVTRTVTVVSTAKN